MNAIQKAFALVVLVGLLACQGAGMAAAPAGSQTIMLSTAELNRLGIRPFKMGLAVVSADGNTLLATDRETDPKLKLKGQVWRLRIFHLDWSGQQATLDSMWLPATSLEQLTMSPDGKWALGIAEVGTRLLAIDLEHKTARIIFQNEKGKAGFRSQPEVAWFENGRFATVGYFYDQDHTLTSEAVASIDIQGSGLDAIQKVRDITDLNHRYRNFAIGQWYNSNQAYFGGLQHDKKIHLTALVGKDEIPVETALAFGGMAVAENRVLYAARWDNKTTGVVLRDMSQKQQWKIGDPKILYNYLYMSQDGKTVLLSYFDLRRKKMTTWYGREKEKFALHPFPGIVEVEPGAIRFSSGGLVAAFYNPAGLTVVRLPAP